MEISQNFVAFSEYMNFTISKKTDLLKKLTTYSLLECAQIKHDLAHHLSTLPIFLEMFIQVFPLSQTFFTISKLLSYVSKNEYTGCEIESTLFSKTFRTTFILGSLKKWKEYFISFLKLGSKGDPNYTVPATVAVDSKDQFRGRFKIGSMGSFLVALIWIRM